MKTERKTKGGVVRVFGVTGAGGCEYVRVCLPNRTSVDYSPFVVSGMQIVRVDMPRARALKYARQLWERRDRIDGLAAQLHAQYPDLQVYENRLPSCDTDTPVGLPAGVYVYVLKDRRKAGRWQVLACYLIA